ncbi:MAG: thiolase family protein [Terriglobales bacterium]
MDIVLLSAVRTPIGRFGGALREQTAADLGVVAARAALARSGVSPEQIGETIFGNARQAGGGPNVARQIGWRAGVPEEAPAFTVNQACASGMQALALASQAVELGRRECVLAGGTEAMSRIPYLAETVRWGSKMGAQPLVDAMYRDGYLCPLANQVMGETAELLAREGGIGREEQDAYALRSQQRAVAAQREQAFADEITPVTLAADRVVAADEHPRVDTSREKLARLPPVFVPAGQPGTVTAGNASAIADGAAALVVASAAFAAREGLRPLARLHGIVAAGVDPRRMGLGPVPATRALLSRLGMRLEQMDAVEINEAFAAQVLACDRELHFNAATLNVAGGAIALGHPTGCSGARIVVTLLHALRRRGGRWGLATLCASGGMGLAAVLELWA